jgi:hypothetical protein
MLLTRAAQSLETPMATVADYITFWDGPVSFGEAVSNHDHPLNIPSNLNRAGNAILLFTLEVVNGQGLDLYFWLMDAPPSADSLSLGHVKTTGNYRGTVHELFPQSELATGKVLRFARQAGTGTVKVGDVVIWFQVDV